MDWKDELKKASELPFWAGYRKYAKLADMAMEETDVWCAPLAFEALGYGEESETFIRSRAGLDPDAEINASH